MLGLKDTQPKEELVATIPWTSSFSAYMVGMRDEAGKGKHFNHETRVRYVADQYELTYSLGVSAVLDCGATNTICGKAWFDEYTVIGTFLRTLTGTFEGIFIGISIVTSVNIPRNIHRNIHRNIRRKIHSTICRNIPRNIRRNVYYNVVK